MHLIKWHNVTHKSSWPDLFFKNTVLLVSFVYNLNLKAHLGRRIWTSQEARSVSVALSFPLVAVALSWNAPGRSLLYPEGPPWLCVRSGGRRRLHGLKVGRENHLCERRSDSSVCTLSGRELLTHMWSFPGGSAVKNLPVVQEMQVQSLGRGDSLEEGMATHSSILAWRIPGTEESGRLQSIGMQRVGHDKSDWTCTSLFVPTYCLYKLFIESSMNINNQQYGKFMNKGYIHTYISTDPHVYALPASEMVYSTDRWITKLEEGTPSSCSGKSPKSFNLIKAK